MGRGFFLMIFAIFSFTKVEAKPPVIGKVHIPYWEYAGRGIPGNYTGTEVQHYLMVIETNGKFFLCEQDYSSVFKTRWKFVQKFQSLDEVKMFFKGAGSHLSRRRIDGFFDADIRRSHLTSEQLAGQVQSNSLRFNPFNAYDWQAFKFGLMKFGVIGTFTGCLGTLAYLATR